MIRCVVDSHENPTFEVSKTMQASSSSNLTIDHIVKLGKSKSSTVIPELIQALESDNGNVRRLAASALGKIRDARAVEPLLKLLERESKPQVRQYAVKALGAIGDKHAEKALLQISGSEDEMYYTRASAKIALNRLCRTIMFSTESAHPSANTVQNSHCASPTLPTDDIDAFLTKSHPRPLTGPWQTGWALGFHSRISGGDWSRSDVGDLTYRLKYESDTSVLPALVQQALDLLHAHPEINHADFVIPVPSSTERKINPVYLFCEALAGKIDLSMQKLVTKTRQTQPQKEMKTLAQKRANVANAFSLRGDVIGKSILLVDDLFDSGATLAEITRLLLKHGASFVNVLTLTRTIHSDA